MADLRPLAPFERRLCVELGCTEEEYQQFLDEMHSQMARKPIPGEAIRCDIITQAVLSVIGLIFQVVGLLLRPQPPSIRSSRGPIGESASPVFGFNSIQELARLGEVIPQVYCDRTTNPAGGTRVNGRLIWSQVESRGNYQLGKFLAIIADGELGSIIPSATAVGQAPLTTLNMSAAWIYYTGRNTGTLLQGNASVYLQPNPQNTAPDPSASATPIYGVPRGYSRTPGTCQSYSPTTANSFGITSVIAADNTVITLTNGSDGSQTVGRASTGLAFDGTPTGSGTRRKIAGGLSGSVGDRLQLTVSRNKLSDTAIYLVAPQQERTKAVNAFSAGTRYILGNTVWRADPFTPGQNANVESAAVTLNFVLTEVLGSGSNAGRLASETSTAAMTSATNITSSGYNNRANTNLYPMYRYFCAAEFASYVTLSKVDALELSIKASVWGELSTQYISQIRYNGNRSRMSAFKLRYRRAGTTAYTDVLPIFYIDRSSKTPTYVYIRLEFTSQANWEVQLYPVVDIPLRSGEGGMFKLDINESQQQISTADGNTICYANGRYYSGLMNPDAAAEYADQLAAQTYYQQGINLLNRYRNTPSYQIPENAFADYTALLVYSSQTVNRVTTQVLDYNGSILNLQYLLGLTNTRLAQLESAGANLNNDLIQSAYWRKPTPYRAEQDGRYSFENGPEFTIVTVNEIQYDSSQSSYYRDCALLGLNIYGGSSRQDISQLSVFVAQGKKITRYDSTGTSFGSSNRFGDIFVDTLTSSTSGLGQYVTAALVDTDSITRANRFTDANQLYFDGIIDQESSWRQWATETAGHSLLQVVTLNGRFGLVPVVPFNTSTGAIDPSAYTIKWMFNESNILEGSYSESLQSAEDALPQIVTVRYRENQFNNATGPINSYQDAGFPRERSASFKLLNEGSTSDKEVVVNCAGDVTTFDQARKLATYLLCARRFEDRVISFKTPEPWLGLAPNDIIRVDTQFTRFASTYAGRIKEDGTYDVIGFTSMPSDATVLVYTPGSGTGVQTFNGATFSPASYPNSLVAIGTTTSESRLFTITKIDIDEDGVAEISAKLFPVLSGSSTRPSLIATALQNPNTYVQQVL